MAEMQLEEKEREMKADVILMGDNHLKPWMFERIRELKEKYLVQKVVCMMDIADDWDKQNHIGEYVQAYDAAIEMARKYPSDAVFCYGNHDICYEWNERESGYSVNASGTVRRKLKELRNALPPENQPVFVKRINNVLFTHGGIRDSFIYQLIMSKGLPISIYDDTDELIEIINRLGPGYLWKDDSPLWFRPQRFKTRMYKEDCMLQVVGHTPVEELTQDGSVLSTDVFSTYSDGTPSGSQQFVLIDTVTMEWRGIKE